MKRTATIGAMFLAAALAGCGGSGNPVLQNLDAATGDCGPGCVAGDAADPGRKPELPLLTDEGAPDDPGQPPADPGVQDPGGVDTGAPPCESSATCQLGQICFEHACIAGCESDRDCPKDKVCNPNGAFHGACVECLGDDACPQGRKCIAGTCVYRCEADGDCTASPGAPHCFAGTGTCVACTQDAHCTLGTVCEAQACTPGCRGDRDCPAGGFCDPASGDHGACFECLADKDCTGGKTCNDHVCGIDCGKISCPPATPKCEPATGACVECLATADCPGGGMVCLNRVCQIGCLGDGDCPGGQRCKAGNPGQCVACLGDGDCAAPLVCLQNACQKKPSCTSDGQCKGGTYCHPRLGECMALPGGYCSPGGGCGLLGLGYCDPLTRTCIDACTLGFCGLLGGSSDKLVCLDGGCYQCATVADCPGTECSQFDLTCVHCSSDDDCATPGWHCSTEGRCYACTVDAHCAPGQKCRSPDQVCVDCLGNADCKNPSAPVCGKDGTCIGACTDECVKGKTDCVDGNPDAYVECGDWDNDPCLEFGSEYGAGGYACPPVQECDPTPDGLGHCVCHDECSPGQAKCDGGYRMTCDQNANSGCYYWGTHSCDTGQVCSNGACVCNNECSSAGAKTCAGDYTLSTCTKDAAGCLYWYDQGCGTDSQGYKRRCYAPGYCYP